MNPFILALTSISPQSLPQPPTDSSEIQIILNMVRILLGALAVLFVTISGLRYILSGGDPQKTARAKEGIIYSLVGLAVAIVAEAVVTYVIGHIG